MAAIKNEPGSGRSGNRVCDPTQEWLEDEAAHELAKILKHGTIALREAAMRQHFVFPNEGEDELVHRRKTQLAGDSEIGKQSYDAGNGVAVNPFKDGLGLNQETVYSLRIARSAQPNIWRRTILQFARLPFKNKLVFQGWDEMLIGRDVLDSNGKLIDRIPGWIDDIDGTGRSMHQWAAEAFNLAMFEGIAYGIVDQDSKIFPDSASRRRAGGRPYASLLRHEDVIRIHLDPASRTRPLVVVVRQPVRKQSLIDPNNWTDQLVPAFKVFTAGKDDEPSELNGERRSYTPVTTSLWVCNADGDFVEDKSQRSCICPEKVGAKLVDIPIVPFYGQRIGAYRGVCPFLDSTWMQLAVFNGSSEMIERARENALTYLFETGIPEQGSNPDELVVDTSRTARYRGSSNSDAKLSWVEQTPGVLAELRNTVDWWCQKILEEHYSIVSQESGGAPVTATEIRIDGVQAASFLEMAVILHEAAWTMICDFMSLIEGLPTRGTVSISHEFGLPSGAFSSIKEVFVAGLMSEAGFWSEAIRNGAVAEDFDIEREISFGEKRRAALESLTLEKGDPEDEAAGQTS